MPSDSEGNNCASEAMQILRLNNEQNLRTTIYKIYNYAKELNFMFGSFLYIHENTVYIQLAKTSLLIAYTNTAAQRFAHGGYNSDLAVAILLCASSKQCFHVHKASKNSKL